MAMMGSNAASHEVPYDALGELAALTADEDVEVLLGSHWRARVMGAWLSAGRTSASINGALLRSLETSQGLLTSTPLAAVAVVNSGEAAVPALEAYLDAHVQHNWGRPGVIVAALEYVGGAVDGLSAGGDERATLAAMVAVAERVGALNANG
nr:DUF6000 family protein [Demequina sp. TTPB684]